MRWTRASANSPPMPIAFYRGMSDSDVKAIVAYLRQVKPVSNKVEKSSYKIPLPDSYGSPVTSVPDVPHGDKVAYGAYLATGLGHCMDCHTPLVQGRNDMHATRFSNWPEVAQHTFLAGDRWAEAVYGKNSVRTNGDHALVLYRSAALSHASISMVREDGRWTAGVLSTLGG